MKKNLKMATCYVNVNVKSNVKKVAFVLWVIETELVTASSASSTGSKTQTLAKCFSGYENRTEVQGPYQVGVQVDQIR